MGQTVALAAYRLGWHERRMSENVDIGDILRAPARRGRPAASAGDRLNRRAAIKCAAMTCLESRPLADISVDEIAAEAGVSRRTFYRFFESKRSLFAQILQERAIAIGQEVARFTKSCPDFPAAIVDGTMETLRLIEEDSIFKMLVEEDSRLMLDIMDVEIDRMPDSLFLTTWRDVFARGRASGALRVSIDDRAAAEWLRGIHFLLTLRPDLNEAEKRSWLTRFVVPSLTLQECDQR